MVLQLQPAGLFASPTEVYSIRRLHEKLTDADLHRFARKVQKRELTKVGAV